MTRRSFELVEATNGGWLLTDRRSETDQAGRVYPSIEVAVGRYETSYPQSAYSNTDDMMKGLAEMLYPKTPVSPGGVVWQPDVGA